MAVQKVYRYDSIYDMVDEVINTDPLRVWQQSMSKYPDPDWDMSAGFDGALDLARDGWADKAEQVQLLADSVAHTDRMTMKTTPEWQLYQAPVGAAVNVPAMLAGRPEHMMMWRQEETEKVKPIVRIGVQCSRSWMVKANEVLERGATIVALIDKLDQLGYGVEVTAVLSSRFNRNAVFEEHCIMSNPNEALDLHALLFALAHPAFSRRLGFALKERHVTNGFWRRNYGVPAPSQCQDDFDVYIDAAPGPDMSGRNAGKSDDAADWIVDMIEGLEVS